MPSLPQLLTIALLIFPSLFSVSTAALEPPASGVMRDGYTYSAVGDITAVTPGKTSSGLMLMGGSDWIEPAFHWFVKKAGNGHIVILRATGADDLQRKMYNDIGGVTSVQTLVFNDREAASDPAVIEILRKADGIFVAGGDQSRYIRFWKGTPLNVAIDEHVRAGKPYGGTSAGLAIVGGSSYGAMDGGSVASDTALRDPLGSAVTIDSGFLHLPFLANVITDSHFAKRDRLGRLIAFVARASHERKNTDIVGLGIDENTALCIDAEGNGTLFTGNGGFAWLVQPQGQPEVLEKNRPLDFRNVRVTGIGAASRFNANTFAVKSPAFESIADVVDGHLELRKR